MCAPANTHAHAYNDKHAHGIQGEEHSDNAWFIQVTRLPPTITQYDVRLPSAFTMSPDFLGFADPCPENGRVTVSAACSQPRAATNASKSAPLRFKLLDNVSLSMVRYVLAIKLTMTVE